MKTVNNRRVGILISYIYTAANAVVQLIYVPLLIGSIGQDEYGLYQLIGSILAYIVSISGVLSAGVGRFYCKYLAEGDLDRAENTLAISRRIFWAVSAVALAVVAVLACTFRGVYGASFTAEQVNECIAMLIVLGINACVTMNNTVSIAAITAHERFVFLKLSSLAVLLLQPVLVIFLVRFFPNALTVTLVVLALNAACALIQGIYSRRALGVGKAYLGWDSRLARGILTFSGTVVLAIIADQIFWKTDQLIVGYMFGASSVAVYAVGAQIYQAYMSVGTAASALFLPRISALVHKDHDMQGMSDLFVRFGRLNGLLLLFLLGGFAVFGQDFIAMWVGEGYFDSYLVALIVMVPYTIDLVQCLGITYLQAIDRYRFRATMHLACAVLNIFLTFVFLCVWGLPGAAASTAISTFVGNGLIMNWYYWKKEGLDIPRFWKEVARVTAPAAVAAAVVGLAYHTLPFRHAEAPSFAVGCLAYGVLFAVLEWRFGMNEREKGLVVSALEKLAKRGDSQVEAK